MIPVRSFGSLIAPLAPANAERSTRRQCAGIQAVAPQAAVCGQFLYTPHAGKHGFLDFQLVGSAHLDADFAVPERLVDQFHHFARQSLQFDAHLAVQRIGRLQHRAAQFVDHHAGGLKDFRICLKVVPRQFERCHFGRHRQAIRRFFFGLGTRTKGDDWNREFAVHGFLANDKWSMPQQR